MNTRQEYLKDMVKNYSSPNAIDYKDPKFRGFSIATRKMRGDKEKGKQRTFPVFLSGGALMWRTKVVDYS